jgi:hypothetical protein
VLPGSVALPIGAPENSTADIGRLPNILGDEAVDLGDGEDGGALIGKTKAGRGVGRFGLFSGRMVESVAEE